MNGKIRTTLGVLRPADLRKRKLTSQPSCKEVHRRNSWLSETCSSSRRRRRRRSRDPWTKGVIVSKLDPVKYRVQVGDFFWKRHMDQLKDLSVTDWYNRRDRGKPKFTDQILFSQFTYLRLTYKNLHTFNWKTRSEVWIKPQNRQTLPEKGKSKEVHTRYYQHEELVTLTRCYPQSERKPPNAFLNTCDRRALNSELFEKHFCWFWTLLVLCISPTFLRNDGMPWRHRYRSCNFPPLNLLSYWSCRVISDHQTLHRNVLFCSG